MCPNFQNYDRRCGDRRPRLSCTAPLLCVERCGLHLLLFLIAQFGSAQVRYAVTLANPERHLVQVTMEIPRGAASHEVQLPVWNALYQVRDFSQYMNWIRAENATGQTLPLAQVNKSRWKLSGTERGARVSYEMFSDDPGSYGAELNARYAFFNLAEILLYADDLRSSPAAIEFRNLPSGWKVATPLQTQGTGYTSANYDQLVDSPVELGTFEEHDFNSTCGTFRVILDRDAPGNSEEHAKSRAILTGLLPPLQRIVSTASSWMNDCPFQKYMFLYRASGGPGEGGMEHSYSTAITLPEKDFDGISIGLLGFSAHEFFHLWDVKRIRPQSLEPVDYTKENYTTALWFSEGVDSTVAEYILLRAGLNDEQHYLEHLSEEITELQNRPAHLAQSVEQSSLDAWLEKYPYYGLPERSISYYNKGELLGVLLDLTMRDASDDRVSLRDLLRWMNEHYAKQGRFFADSPAVRDAAESISHAELRDFFAKYVSGTDEILWDKFFARVGLQVTHTTVELADPGFEAVQKFDEPPTVVQVESNSAAERAGLKSGDDLVRINGEPAGRDFEKQIAKLGPGETVRLSLRRDGTKIELQWNLGRRTQTLYHLHDVPGVSPQQRERRAVWLFDHIEKTK